jgi:hypothetical protein
MKLESDNLKKKTNSDWSAKYSIQYLNRENPPRFFYEIGHFMTKYPIQYLNRENSLRF